MDRSGNNNNNDESLVTRIQQLEHERDALHKDIEQMCLQQAGPSYLVIATRMHFQRTAGLEQEIESLKKKLTACTRDNLNLQEELSEVYRIKSQMADLHDAEVSKNIEAEKQVKFFQGCVAAAFSERDHSLMEAEKAKEKEEAISYKLNDLQKRLEEFESVHLQEKKLQSTLQIDLMKLKEQNANFDTVIMKFYNIRQRSLGVSDNLCMEDKCQCLLTDAPEVWSFDSDREISSSQYIDALEKELAKLRISADNVQNKLRVGLEIENHLRKNVHQLKEKKIVSDDLIKKKISELRDFHSNQRIEVMNVLEQEDNQLKLIFGVVQEKIKEFHVNKIHKFESLQTEKDFDDIECRDVHITVDTSPSPGPEVTISPLNNMTDGVGDTSQALEQALCEKVATLLLLSQQEERHLLETNVNTALQEKMEELQRNLLQVTNEKVKALMELAQVKQKYQELQENTRHGVQQCGILDRSIGAHEREGKLKNLLNRTYLKRWIYRQDLSGDGCNGQMSNDEGNFTNKKSTYSVDFARMKIENATLKESRDNVEHLTSAIHKLRISLLKAVQDYATLGSSGSSTVIKLVDDIIADVNVLKIALGSCLPVSWSAEAKPEDPTDGCGDFASEKLDFVSAAGFEMVELLMLAAQILKENIIGKSFSLFA